MEKDGEGRKRTWKHGAGLCVGWDNWGGNRVKWEVGRVGWGRV